MDTTTSVHGVFEFCHLHRVVKSTNGEVLPFSETLAIGQPKSRCDLLEEEARYANTGLTEALAKRNQLARDAGAFWSWIAVLILCTVGSATLLKVVGSEVWMHFLCFGILPVVCAALWIRDTLKIRYFRSWKRRLEELSWGLASWFTSQEVSSVEELPEELRSIAEPLFVHNSRLTVKLLTPQREEFDALLSSEHWGDAMPKAEPFNARQLLEVRYGSETMFLRRAA